MQFSGRETQKHMRTMRTMRTIENVLDQISVRWTSRWQEPN